MFENLKYLRIHYEGKHLESTIASAPPGLIFLHLFCKYARVFLNFIGQLKGFQATVVPNTVNALQTTLQLFGAIATDLGPGDFILVTLPQQV